MSKNSKAYRAAAEKLDRNHLYTPLEAAKLAKETNHDRPRHPRDPAVTRNFTEA